jgi:inner membrane protein
MMAPTHIAFAVACGMLGGAEPVALKLMAAGALLPDLDHPQSTIGRVFFFLSIPLHKAVGHRQSIHGFTLWTMICALGLIRPEAGWLGLGALSHVFLDCLNISGVQALMPFSEKVCVMFGRRWRFAAGSKNELFLLIALGIIAWSGNYIGNLGGLRTLVGLITGSYQVAYQQYLDQGLTICQIEGKLRHRNGKTEEGEWTIIGRDRDKDLAILYGDEILRISRQAEFLRARLRPGKERWDSARVQGWVRTRNAAFFYDGQKWKRAGPGNVVFGQVIGRGLELETVDVAKVGG